MGRPKIHGHGNSEGSPTYRVWLSIKQRCGNPKHTTYQYYGGRGIVICARWLSFANFLADMGERPAGTSIDRIDNDGNYEPGNCRWATRKEQGYNRRSNRYYEYRGQMIGVEDALKISGSAMGYSTVRQRLARGWTLESALSAPPHPGWHGSHKPTKRS